MGSYGGLLRFDGSEFHNFSTEGAIATPAIRCIVQAPDGTLLAVDSDFSRERITAVCSYHKNKWVTPAMALFMELTREHFASL